jgi:hypothetical protein
VGRNGGKKRNISCPHAENGNRDSNGGPHLLVLYWRARGREIQVVKDNGSARLQCFTPVILATQEADIRRIEVQGSKPTQANSL